MDQEANLQLRKKVSEMDIGSQGMKQMDSKPKLASTFQKSGGVTNDDRNWMSSIASGPRVGQGPSTLG